MPFDLEWVRSLLPGREVHWYDRIESTMPAAVQLASAGCAPGTNVGADEQTAGQGRFGRTWQSERDAGLYFSVVLDVPSQPAEVPLLTLALGVAVARAIHNSTGLDCDLRWPNDVLIGGKKCAGVLTTLQEHRAVAGIGVNVNQTRFSPELTAIATSLEIASGREHSREVLLVSLAESIDAQTQLLVRGAKREIPDAFSRASSFVRGRKVTVEDGASIQTGITDGLDPSGFLLLRKDGGGTSVILNGGVRPAPGA